MEEPHSSIGPEAGSVLGMTLARVSAGFVDLLILTAGNGAILLCLASQPSLLDVVGGGSYESYGFVPYGDYLRVRTANLAALFVCMFAVVAWTYSIGSLLLGGATVGKRLLRLRVTGAGSSALTHSRAVLRATAQGMLCLPLGGIYCLAVFFLLTINGLGIQLILPASLTLVLMAVLAGTPLGEVGRAWHDKIAGTTVIRLRRRANS